MRVRTGVARSSICCPIADDVCSQRVDEGDGMCAEVGQSTRYATRRATMYYHDPLVGVCRAFVYAGCGGNANRFATRNECALYCQPIIKCAIGDPLFDSVMKNRLAACHEDAHCPREYACEAAAQRRVCCPSRAAVCALALNEGRLCPIAKPSTRWRMDAASGRCVEFTYDGCEGNLNTFASVEHCNEFCYGPCPGGALAHVNAFTGQSQLCEPPFDDVCPAGFVCSQTSVGTSLCCAQPPVCPQVRPSIAARIV